MMLSDIGLFLAIVSFILSILNYFSYGKKE